MNKRILAASVLTAVLGLAVHGQTYTLTPLTSFGGGDGWLAPGEDPAIKLGTGSLERGLAYNSATGNLLLVSRAGGVFVEALDGTTGAQLSQTSIGGHLTGGTFTGSMIGVSGDGAIYVGNLTTGSGSSNFKLYSWASQSSLTAGDAPTVAYNANPVAGIGAGSARFGDTLDVIGSGAATRVAVGAGSSPAGFNSFAVINPSDGTASWISYAGTAPANGDFRLGLTYIDTDTVIGTQAGGFPFRVVDFTGTAGTLSGSPATLSASERLMDYATIGGVGYLATADTASSLVRIYDMSDPTNPMLVASANNTSGPLTANGNGVGQVQFGAITGNSATLYAMSANQGIQAMTFTVVPEPEEYAMMAAGSLIAFGVWRRFRR